MQPKNRLGHEMGTDHTSDALLTVDDIHIRFKQRNAVIGKQVDLKAVDGVSFEIRPGETLGLVGESGSGKTTTAHTILGLQKPRTGRVLFRGTDIYELDQGALRKARKHYQLVPQDALGSLNPKHRVGRTLAEPLRIHKVVPREAVSRRVNELLESVGLKAGIAKRYPHELSGGQLRRVGIARALSTEPELIITDEPTSHLDISVQATILNLLKDLQRGLDLSVLLISHDLSVVRHMCTRVAVMYFGRIVEIGTNSQVFDTPQHPYTKALLAAAPSAASVATGVGPKPIGGEVPSLATPPHGCSFNPRCSDVIDRCYEAEPAIAKTGCGSQAACFLTGSPAKSS